MRQLEVKIHALKQFKIELKINFFEGIRSMVKMVDAIPDKNQQKLLDKKLDKCRNPENNPDCEM